ncbi:hypothetical protein [Streptomyces luteogriseus]|uniref:hypothetical protein n=1 Tax=Streptomyces luteogriseus TaxID=68233 RepID=UPI002608A18D|nr:hypothetical protein [uncultured Streptomyces sp.]
MPQPQQHNHDPYLVALARLEEKVSSIAQTQSSHAKWIMSITLLVVGIIGGPEAVQAVTQGTAQ